MQNIGYFTEIEMLKSEIANLNNKLTDERTEYMEIYQKMKTEAEASNKLIIELTKKYEKMVNIYDMTLLNISTNMKKW